jgi:hypothetical protein
MAKNVEHVSHIKSKLKTNGLPQLPTADKLVDGEIAINYAEGVETISIRNENSAITTFSSDNYYTEKKLGSGFTGENSAKTVTDVIEENELATSTALNDLNSKMVTEIESSNGSITTSTSTKGDGSVKTDIQTDASKISGLTAVPDSDEGAAKISGVTSTSSVKKGIENLYKSLASEIAARKAALLARTISSANKGITVTETPNADGYSTTLTLTLDASTNGSGKEKLGNDNALTITDNGLFLSSNWTCGEYYI